MNSQWILGVIVAAAIGCQAGQGAWPAAQRKPIRAVVLTGGHDYDKNMFPKLFAGYDDIQVEYRHQNDDSELFEDVSGFNYDVIVLYNMSQKITPKRQQNLLSLLDKGVGVVALHHNMAAYSDWPEYGRIIGVKYFLKPTEWDGKTYPQCTYKHDLNMPIKVEDPKHPVTQGMKDFVIHDESYKGQWFDPEAKVLLTTTEPTSDRVVALAKTYRKSRVCTIQLGHGPNYDDPNYRQVVSNAIRWTAAGQK